MALLNQNFYYITLLYETYFCHAVCGIQNIKVLKYLHNVQCNLPIGKSLASRYRPSPVSLTNKRIESANFPWARIYQIVKIKNIYFSEETPKFIISDEIPQHKTKTFPQLNRNQTVIGSQFQLEKTKRTNLETISKMQ